ncbi:hypothetical protein LTS10_011559 [Elasticomyces elasticus]|nr:hypothetical protein LTS10_011559 [Elasticomyces elasticus]
MATHPIVRPGLFFTLPPEIRDIIFELAYPRTNPEILFKCDWQGKQDRLYKQDRANYIPASFGECKVSHWMVSKEFFIGAARAYMSAQQWRDRAVSGFLSDGHGLFYQFAQHAHVRMITCIPELSRCRQLTSLTVDLNEYAFEDIRPGLHVWEDVCSDTDFEELEFTERLLALRRAASLKSLQFTAEKAYYANTAAKKQTWQDNVRRYQDYIWAKIKQNGEQYRRPNGEQRTGKQRGLEQPLYWWSRVCFDTNKLLPEDVEDDETEYMTGPLADNDVPETEDELFDMLEQRGPDFVAWVRAKKAPVALTEEWFDAVEEISDQK